MPKAGFYVQKIEEGDQSAFRSFMDMYSKDLYHFALGYVNTREIAEEIVSDVFLEVWNNRRNLHQIQQIKPWLLIIVRNKAISYLRKEHPDTTVSFDEIEDYYIPLVQSPDHAIISEEEIKKINQAISSLPPKCKEVFMLAKIEKTPYKEIAQILNISVKTINIHIAKALSLISQVLGK